MRSAALVVVIAACGGPRAAPVEPVPAPEPAPPPVAAPPPAADPAKPPVAKPRLVQDTFHGVTVDDPYRWLEGDAADVKAWSDGQNRFAREHLDKLPEIDKLRAEVTAIFKAPITHYGGFAVAAGGKMLFGMRKHPSKEQAELIVMASPDDAANVKLVLDPTARGDAHVTIDWFVPSPDGTRVAVSLSEKGSEKGDLHVIDLDGKDVEPVIPNVQRGTGGGDVAWTADGKGLYYTRYPSAGEKPEAERDFWMQLWFHALGTPVANDRYEIGKDLPKIAEVIVEVDHRSGRVLAKVQNGDGGTFRHYIRDTKGAWRQITDWDDQVIAIGFGAGGDLWLVSHKDAPRGKVMKLAATAPLAKAKLVVAEGKDSIVTSFYANDWGVIDGGDRIYVNYQTGGPSEVRAFTYAGKPTKAPALPPVSSAGKPVVWRDGVLVSAQGYTTPRTIYRFSGKTGTTEPIAALSPKPPVDLSGYETHREYAASKDGTKVPLNIVWPKNAPRDGSVPCVATGYGGYGASQEPHFVMGQAPMLSRGICYVEANLRGGAEFGEDWHRAGMLTRKQNVFDDFAAVLAFLVEAKYTRRDRLGIIGGSNGGLLMGATITQHPDMMKAVVSYVGVYDMLRVEQTANGQYNIPEYGTVANEAQFKALHAYSPYHRVTPGTAYPAILFVTGANDPRVEPWHSRKMTAALQAAQAAPAPILLRTNATSGHGAGTTTEAIDQVAHVMAFLLSQLR